MGAATEKASRRRRWPIRITTPTTSGPTARAVPATSAVSTSLATSSATRTVVRLASIINGGDPGEGRAFLGCMSKVILEMDENIGDERVGIRVRRNGLCWQGVLNRQGQNDVGQLLRGVVIDERRLFPLQRLQCRQRRRRITITWNAVVGDGGLESAKRLGRGLGLEDRTPEGPVRRYAITVVPEHNLDSRLGGELKKRLVDGVVVRRKDGSSQKCVLEVQDAAALDFALEACNEKLALLVLVGPGERVRLLVAEMVGKVLDGHVTRGVVVHYFLITRVDLLLGAGSWFPIRGPFQLLRD